MNTKTLTLVLALSALSPSLSAIAQEHVGNGGDILNCVTKAGVLYSEFYDVNEAPRNKFIPQVNPKWTFNEAMDEYLNRLQRVDRIRYDRFLQNESGDFIADLHVIDEELKAGQTDETVINAKLKVTHLDPGELNNIPDEGVASFPNNNEVKCTPHQLVIQLPKADFLGTKSLFTIGLPQWKTLPDYQKADVAIHELFYREAASKGYFDSRYARYLNSMILGNVSRYEYATHILETDQKAAAEGHPKMSYPMHADGEFDCNATRITKVSSGWITVETQSEKGAIYDRDFKQVIAQFSQRAIENPNFFKLDAIVGFIFSGGMVVTGLATSGIIATLPFSLPAAVAGGAALVFGVYGKDTDKLGAGIKTWYEQRKQQSIHFLQANFVNEMVPHSEVQHGYLFSTHGSIRYIADPFLFAVKTKDGKKMKHIKPVLEFDEKGNLIQESDTADWDSVLTKLQAEQSATVAPLP